MANWWEEKDEFGYTYADKNRPGYMGPVPKEEEVQAPEEEVEGFHEDFYEEDEVTQDDKKFVQKEFMDVDLTDEQKKLSRVLEDEKSPDVGLPQEEITPFAKQLEGVEPQILRDVDVNAEKKIKELMKKAVGAKGKKRSVGYANVYKALEAYKGKETPFLKGLKTRFSKKASETRNKQHLGDYADFFNRGYSWKVRSPDAPPSSSRASSSRASASTQRDASNDRYFLNAPEEAIVANKEYLKDGRLLTRGTRPEIFLNGEEIVVTGNHLEATPSRQSGRQGAHAKKPSRWGLNADGKFKQTAPNARTNFGWDYYSKKTVPYNQGRDGDFWEFETRGRDGNVRKSRMPMKSPVAGKVVHQ